MTPDEIALILHRLSDHTARLERIEEHVASTNGRVSRLELWRARGEGFRAALSWLPQLALGIAVGISVAVVTTLIA